MLDANRYAQLQREFESEHASEFSRLCKSQLAKASLSEKARLVKELVWFDMSRRQQQGEDVRRTTNHDYPMFAPEETNEAIANYCRVLAGESLATVAVSWEAFEKIDPILLDTKGGANDSSIPSQESSDGQATNIPSNLTERFHLTHEHAKGGLGVVFVAEDRQIERTVAIKQIRAEYADEPLYREKFLREASVTGKLEHPSIVPVYALGKDSQGRPYYAMRFIKGQDLRTRIGAFHESVSKRETEFDGMALRKLLRRFIDVCQAVDYAHNRGILHRDLKPSNIMLGKYGETLVVDWGLARPFENKPNQTAATEQYSVQSELPLIPADVHGNIQTRMGSFLGSKQYASPEQLRGALDSLGPQSDVYSLGAILFEILTGKPPVSGDTPISAQQLADDILLKKLPTARGLNASVPRALDAICGKAMSGQIDERYPTANALRADIEAFLDDEVVSAGRETWWTKARRSARKNPSLVSGISVAAVGVVAFLLLTSVLTQRQNSLLTTAYEEKEEALRASKANEEVARNQSQLVVETLSGVIQQMQDGFESGLQPDRVRQRLFADIMDKMDRIDPRFTDSDKVTLNSLAVMINFARAVVGLGKVEESSFSAIVETDPAEDPTLHSNRREVQGLRQMRRTLAEPLMDTAGKSSQSIDTPLRSAQALLELAGKQIDAEWEKVGSHEGRLRQLLTISQTLATARKEAGMLPAASQLLEFNARKSRELFETANTDLSVAYILADSLRQLAEIQINTLQVDAGIANLEQALKVAREFPERQSDSAMTKAEFDFRLCHAQIATLLGSELLKKKSSTEVIPYFEECQGVLDELRRLKEYAQDARLVRASANNLVTLANLYETKGIQALAESSRAQAEQQLRKLTQSQNSDAQALRTLAWIYIKRADAMLESEENKIQSLYNQAHSLLKSIYEANPNDRETQRDFSTAIERLAVLAMEEDVESSVPMFEEVLSLRKSLAQDANDWLAQLELGATYSHFAEIERARDDMEKALQYLDKQHSITVDLAQRYPSEPEIQQQMLYSLCDLADLQLELDNPATAQQFLETALEVVGRIDFGEARRPYKQTLKQIVAEQVHELKVINRATLPLEDILQEEVPFQKQILTYRILILCEEDAVDEAVDSLEALAALPRENPQEYIALASCYAEVALAAGRAADSLSESGEADTPEQKQWNEKQAQLQTAAMKIAAEIFNAGHAHLSSMRADPDLELIRADSRWKEIDKHHERSREVAKELLANGALLRITTDVEDIELNTLERLPAKVHAIPYVNLSGYRGEDFAILKLLPEIVGLRHVMLERLPTLRDADLEPIGKCATLEILGLGETENVTAMGLRWIGKLPNLKQLYLGTTGFSLESAREISELPAILLLDVNTSHIDDAALEAIDKLGSLRDLCLTNNTISDLGIAKLRNLKLYTLRLNETDVTDEAIAILSSMESLTTLDLAGTKITDACIEHLLKLKGLENINLENNKISAAALEKLVQLEYLDQIRIHGCGLSADEVRALKLRLDFCNVDDVTVRISERQRNKGRKSRPD
ncbi:MAG: protein kinase [Pirellulaceae bacterium]|nr:protein kinase [Pirellulaceae bacterium]